MGPYPRTTQDIAYISVEVTVTWTTPPVEPIPGSRTRYRPVDSRRTVAVRPAVLWSGLRRHVPHWYWALRAVSTPGDVAGAAIQTYPHGAGGSTVGEGDGEGEGEEGDGDGDRAGDWEGDGEGGTTGSPTGT
jgi:hypothetical protein